MLPDEYTDRCSSDYTGVCWIREKAQYSLGWERLFPQKFWAEKSKFNYQVWDFYVHWKVGSRGRVNTVRLCHLHGNRLWRQWGDEGAEEKAISERQDAWVIENGGRFG